jgi:hypothetical protein
MRIVLAGLAGGLAAGLTTVLWLFFGRHAPPVVAPAAAAAAAAMLVGTRLKKKVGPSTPSN